MIGVNRAITAGRGVVGIERVGDVVQVLVNDHLDDLIADRVGPVVLDDWAEEGALSAGFHVGDGGLQKRHPAFRREDSCFDLSFDLLFDPGSELLVSSSRASFNMDAEVGAANLVVW